MKILTRKSVAQDILKRPVLYQIRWALLLLWVLLGFFVFYRIYGDTRQRAFQDLTAVQGIHARQAAKGMEEYIGRWTTLLLAAAESHGVVDLDQTGKNRLAFILAAYGSDVRAVTRVDLSGRIIYTLPENPDAVGADISSQDHVRRILKTRAPVMSDVFTAVQGYPAVAVHVPVFDRKAFRGTLAVLLDFREIAKRYLDVIRVGESTTAHLITARGVQIYSPFPDHVGKPAPETAPGSPGFSAMVHEMVQGRQGSAAYSLDPSPEKGKGPAEYRAMYLPVRLADTFWSLAVASESREVLKPLESLRMRLIAVIGILFAGIAVFTYFAIRAWGIVKEEEQRKKAEETLRFERSQLLSILDSIDATIYVADLKTYEVLFLNRHMKLLFGEKAVGEPCFSAFRGETSPCAHCTNDRLLDAEGNPTGVIVWEGQNPITRKWYLNYDRAIRWIDGRMVRLQIASDITERKEMEETLRASEAKYRSVLEANPDPVVVYDMEGKVVYFNPAFTRVFGWSLDERIGKKLDDFVPEEAWPETRAMIQKVLAGERFSGVETLRFNNNGEKIPVSISGAFGKDKEGKIVNSIINLRDITEEKKMKAQLQQAMKMEAIGTLSGGIAHEFNNILAIILGNTELAVESVPEWSPARHHLEETRSACLRARDVVRQLLSFSRKSEVKKTAVAMAPLVKESLRLLRASIPSLIEIRTRIDDDAGAVLGDPTQIHQVLINLCTNARDAMAENGGILEIGLKRVDVDEQPKESLSQLSRGRYVELSVRDTGNGIDPRDIDRIFDPFFTTKEVGQGTGMGLAVVHGIVKAHEGIVVVRSEKGKGTVFTLHLPATDASSEPLPKPVETLIKGNESILFVDDEDLVVELSHQILERLGYRVKSTQDPLEALKWFRSDPGAFDLVITDMTMPKISGDRLAKTLMEIRPDIRVILSTGYSERISEEKAREMGIRALIMKPIEIVKLSAAVRAALDGRASETQKA